MKLIDLTGKEVEVKGCLGCELANEELAAFGGLLYKSKNFAIMQDFELPIDGFIIISSRRHVVKWTELSEEEQSELVMLINKTLKILEENNVAKEYNVILEEKAGYHFHIWLMPRHQWMIEKFGKVLKNIKQIQEYALENLRTKENIKRIEKTCKLLKKELNKK